MTTFAGLPTPPALPAGMAGRPSMADTHDRWPFPEALSYLISRRMTGRLTLYPSGVILHLNDGRVDGAQGHRLLGDVLLEQGLVNVDDLTAALITGGLLGQTLLRARRLTALQLRGALRQQVRGALRDVLATPPERYEFVPGTALPSPSAGVPGGEVLAEALTRGGTLPLGTIFQLAPVTAPVSMTPDQWALLRWVNGRRSLRRAVQLSGLPDDLAFTAARQLIELEVVEHSAITELKFIVAQLKPASSVRQPPAGIRGNLFIKYMDGTQDVWSVVQKLNFPPEEAASLLCAMHRDDLLDIVQGRAEFQRLLEQY
ncbi:DUF4388 domain-containing protein [Deinococcus yunweiensis]|uniref:DUF4388 domain-containing protein n=1 Tax=Deinococcus yunweiensis TaxID=367282 RepID=UPI00398F45CB